MFGLDNRSANNYQEGNSDVVMIASIDNKTKMSNWYRYTVIHFCQSEAALISSVTMLMPEAGAKQAVQMLNSNLDLDIKEYVCGLGSCRRSD